MQLLHDHPRDTVGHLRLKVVWPFDESLLAKFPNAETFVVPEQNLGQIAREIERHVDAEVISVPKLGGALHTPDELNEVLEGLA
jgi:2-oxoglutarate ferredoxin oxidoreductase subunit alpha